MYLPATSHQTETAAACIPAYNYHPGKQVLEYYFLIIEVLLECLHFILFSFFSFFKNSWKTNKRVIKQGSMC